MNFSKKGSQPAQFQPAQHEKRFKERSVSKRPIRGTNENDRNNLWYRHEKKPDENRPHVERQPRSDEYRNRRQAQRSTALEPHITRETRETVRGAKVQVTIKNTALNGQPDKVKKTGPLSPRAPEKIKKNRSEEMKVYGENACLTLFAQRPDAIVRVWATVEAAHKIGEMFSYLAANKKVYRVVGTQELNLVSGSEHHGGICMLVKKPRPFTLSGYLDIARQQDCLVLLDGVRNAHNIGGIIRTCAFYGVKGVVTEDPEQLNATAAMRVAEGGAEYIHALQTDDLRHALSQLRQAGYQIVHTTMDKQAQGIAKVRLENKVVFVLSESTSTDLAEKSDTLINLSFANPLQKNGLNVAVQAGVLLAHWTAS